MARPVLLLGTASTTAQGVMTAARSLSVPVHLAVQRGGEEQVAHGLLGQCAGTVLTDFRRPAQAVGRLAEYCARQGIGGVAAEGECLAPLAAAVAAARGLPGHPPGRAADVRDRWRMVQSLLGHGVPVPRTLAVLSPRAAEARCRAAGLDFPVVVRPAQSWGAAGAAVVPSARELPEAVRRVLEPRENADYGIALAPVALVQEYVEGPEYRVESVLRAGCCAHLVMLRSLSEDGPVRRAAGYTLPAGLPGATALAVLAAVERGLAALGLRDGLVHTALRMTAAGPKLLTVGIAAPEVPVGQMIEYATGVSTARVYVQAVLGERPEIRPHGLRPCALRYITTSGHGVFLGLRGLLASPYVANVRSYLEPGSRVGGRQENPTGDVRTRIGHVIVTADDPDQADVRAAEALAAISTHVGTAVAGADRDAPPSRPHVPLTPIERQRPEE
ncbi:ATP-grasp domain-containing protein [Streptomyces sp. NPDC003660]